MDLVTSKQVASKALGLTATKISEIAPLTAIPKVRRGMQVHFDNRIELVRTVGTMRFWAVNLVLGVRSPPWTDRGSGAISYPLLSTSYALVL